MRGNSKKGASEFKGSTPWLAPRAEGHSEATAESNDSRSMARVAWPLTKQRMCDIQNSQGSESCPIMSFTSLLASVESSSLWLLLRGSLSFLPVPGKNASWTSSVAV